MLNPNNVRNFLLQALDQAVIRRGFCAPNPSVGALIINDAHTIIASGYHHSAGSPHAEIEAIKNIQEPITQNTILFVTLEPCCHYGKTPPCTEAIIRSGIKHVVYAYSDPNPIVTGNGHQALANAGISCSHIPLPEVDTFYRSYSHWHRTKTPFVTAKIALTLDGKIAGKNSEPIKITGNLINQFTHHQRKKHDAILTSIKTIMADDPQLNVRINDEIIPKSIYILDSSLQLSLNAKLITTSKTITIFHKIECDVIKRQKLLDLGVKCIPVDFDENGLNLNQILSYIGQDGIHDLWIEAGGKVFSNFVEQQLLQRALIYIAPSVKSDGKSAFSKDFQIDFSAQNIRWEQFGQDVLCEINW